MPWAEILAKASAFAEQCLGEGSIAWFRGHPNANYKLRSTLHRHLDLSIQDLKAAPDAAAYRVLLCEEYKTLYRRFKQDAWPLLGSRSRSEWGVVFAMQHYGLPTRLLDWTESFACAVFFALHDRKPDTDAAIWCLDPQALNATALDQGGLVSLDDDVSTSNIDTKQWHPRWMPPKTPARSVAVSPLFTNPRMTAQRSAFTVAGDSAVPLDAEYEDLVKHGKLFELVLPAATCNEAAAYLAMANLTAFTFYPDLHGLALRHKAQAEERRLLARRLYAEQYK